MSALQHLVFGLRLVAEFIGWCVILFVALVVLTIARYEDPFEDSE